MLGDLGTLQPAKDNLRVLHVASGDLWAGAEVQLWQLLRQLAQSPQLELAAALMNEGELAGRLRAAGIDVEVIDESRLGAAAIFRRLRQLMREFRPDIVHTHRSKENLLGLAANLASVRAPMIRTVHGANEHPTSWRRPARHMISLANEFTGRQLTAAVIGVSSGLAEALRNEHGYRNVRLIPNGIDIAAIVQAQVAAPFREARDRARHVGLVGRLEPVKRGDLFLEAAALACREHPDEKIAFHVFGEGSQRREMEQRAAALGLGDRVLFHGHTPEVVTWLSGLDALVLCSDHEGLPMILLEAIAAGTPVVGHAVGGIAEVMQGDVGGVLVERHDARGYAEAIGQVLASDPQQLKISVARDRLHAEYSSSSNAAQTLALYEVCARTADSWSR
jgi:glycosyltransferase involved in cell wall biosynthesis